MAKVVRVGALNASDYQQYTPKQHIFEVPDTYIGSERAELREEWVYDFTNQRMVLSTITLPQGVERLFLEILSNAGDNAARAWLSKVDPGKIEVEMDSQRITIRNGGTPIPIERHPEKDMWVPEMIFGTLLTSSNYDKTVVRMGCGRNGYGAKLVNIFSQEFIVEVGDDIRKLAYRQVWSHNMDNREDPQIVSYDGPAYVQISYVLDFPRFQYTEYPTEAYHLFARFVLDFSFTCKVPVIFNGLEFNLRQVRDYATLYLGQEKMVNSLCHYEWPSGTETIRLSKKDGGGQMARDPCILPDLEMCLVDTPDDATVISFVNGMMTVDGGAHVEVIQGAIAKSLLEVLNREKKGKKDEGRVKLTPSDVRPHLSLILACRIPDPTYTSQTKTRLGAPRPHVKLSDDALQPILKWSVVERLLATMEAKAFKKLAGTDGKKRKHIKLEKGDDANEAGGPRSSDCTLMITEGQSAAAYATTFRGLIPNGPDTIGILPIKGKLLNVLNANPLQIAENKEITEMKKMLGLQEGVDYTKPANRASLRYGRILIAADQDNDGSHIKALIMLFFGARFPSIIQLGMLMCYNTPLLRLFKGKNTLSFYSQREYETWKAGQEEREVKKWTHKYCKGLGSSTKSDVEEDLKHPRYITCFYDDRTPDALRLAFDERLADDRKKWILEWAEPLQISPNLDMQPISEFIFEDLIQYTFENLTRSIPKLLDGLKESQRKILWSSFDYWKSSSPGTMVVQNPKEAKVGIFSATAVALTKYHHGPDILSSVTVVMAQDFVGSNNMPYFQQDGQFGTRKAGGKDNAAIRYIGTRPEWWINYVYKKADVPLLELGVVEDETVEPKFLLPILPMQLINGATGVATGFSTFIPNHDPLEVVAALIALIKGDTPPPLVPKYRGFVGKMEIGERRPTRELPPPTETEGLIADEDVEDIESAAVSLPARLSLISTGVFKQTTKNMVTVSELPIGCWTNNYKKWLIHLRDEEKSIKDFRDLSTDTKVHFEITGMKEASIRKLRLVRTYGLTNMVLLDENDRPVHYQDANAILQSFYNARLPYFEKRRQYLIAETTAEISKLTERYLFLGLVMTGELIIMNRPKKEVLADMAKRQINPELFTSVRTSAFSEEEIGELQQRIEELEQLLAHLVSTTPQAMWLEDLNEFVKAYQRHEK